MKLEMNKATIKAQIDVCGKSVAYVAENAYKVVDDNVMWALNQATISLQEALRLLDKEDNE